jgi:hypothetical protein
VVNHIQKINAKLVWDTVYYFLLTVLLSFKGRCFVLNIFSFFLPNPDQVYLCITVLSISWASVNTDQFVWIKLGTCAVENQPCPPHKLKIPKLIIQFQPLQSLSFIVVLPLLQSSSVPFERQLKIGISTKLNIRDALHCTLLNAPQHWTWFSYLSRLCKINQLFEIAVKYCFLQLRKMIQRTRTDLSIYLESNNVGEIQRDNKFSYSTS